MANISVVKKTNSPSQVPLLTWIGVFASILGAFMAALDIQITNASLQEIQLSLAVSSDEVSWISTSYLVAEIIVIPLSGWLSHVFTLRRYLLVNTALFIFFSVCCTWAWDLNSMILFRTLQGLAGGVLIPSAMTIVLISLPSAKQPIGLAAFGISIVLAPSIATILGGWLTENLSWHYNFYINLIPGALIFAGIWYGIYQQKPQYHLLQQCDWLGIASMIIGLGFLQVLLEEVTHQKNFSSQIIVRFSVVAIILVLFFAIELKRKKPFINLRLLKERNFGLASIINFYIGFSLYGSIYILPLYLTQIQNYNVLQIGQILIWAGIPQLFTIPLIPKITRYIDARFLVAFGIALFSISTFMNARFTYQTGYDQLIWSQVVQGIGKPLIMAPLASIATVGLPPKNADSSSSIFNVMLNLGSLIGVTAMASLFTTREQFHLYQLDNSMSLHNLETESRINQLTQYFYNRGFDLSTAQEQALKSINNIVHREASIMAFNDCFYVIGIGLLVSCIAVLFFKKVKITGTSIGY
ncbi:MAG: multidrug efflux MFS transporter [Calothrix sp. C42_A2020_038]|nr:multidrug efflux MFS transporter [Calothrix sp. C42_A2020_038]